MPFYETGDVRIQDDATCGPSSGIAPVRPPMRWPSDRGRSARAMIASRHGHSRT